MMLFGLVLRTVTADLVRDEEVEAAAYRGAARESSDALQAAFELGREFERQLNTYTTGDAWVDGLAARQFGAGVPQAPSARSGLRLIPGGAA